MNSFYVAILVLIGFIGFIIAVGVGEGWMPEKGFTRSQSDWFSTIVFLWLAAFLISLTMTWVCQDVSDSYNKPVKLENVIRDTNSGLTISPR